MNKKKGTSSLLSLLIINCSLLIAMAGCGPQIDLLPWQVIDESQDAGTDEPGSVDLGNVELSILEGELMNGIPKMINYATHQYQYQRANSIDVFAGYFMVAHSAFSYGGPLLNTYAYPNGYYGGPVWESKPMYPYLYHAYFYGEEHGMPEWKAIAEIVYAYSMQELTDFYGPVPYDDYRKLKETPPLTYISTQEAYSRILADLEEAITLLKQAQPSAQKLERVEGTVGGFSDLNWKNWVKFANSLRLRMALNMVKADPVKAQQVAESAVNDEIGVLTYNDKDFQLSMNGNPEHPLFGISSSWNDSRLGASLENIAKRYNSPLLGKWFNKNSATIKANGQPMLTGGVEYVGMRQGCDVDPANVASGYGAFSSFKDGYMPRTYLKVVETLFLRAEGALRGWNMKGNAKDLYEQGIKKSFEENSVSGYEEYIAQEGVEDIDYEDYYKPQFSIAGRVTVGVAWDDDDLDEVKLEKIITQKYIANFPMSAEAWTTFRRTAYPRLFPVPEKNAWSDNSFDVELQIRRIPYDNKGTANDLAEIANVEAALGAKNTAGARLWWDVPTEKRKNDDPKGEIIPKNF